MASNDTDAKLNQLLTILLNDTRRRAGSANITKSIRGNVRGEHLDTISNEFDEFEKVMKKGSGKFNDMITTVGKVISANKNLQYELSKVAASVAKTSQGYSVDVKKISENTIALMKSTGAFDKAVLKNLKNQTQFNSALGSLVRYEKLKDKLENDKIAILAEQNRLDEFELKLKRGKKKRTPEQKAEIELMKARIKQMKEDIKNTSYSNKEHSQAYVAVMKLSQQLDKNSFVFQNLSKQTQEAISTGSLLTMTYKEQIAILDEVNEVSTVHAKAVRENAKITVRAGVEFKNKILEVASMIKSGFKMSLDYIGDSLTNFDAQLKNNVFESHYADAFKMGMSDAQMSEILGKYLSDTRTLTGTEDGSKILDNNRLERLQEQVGYLYGLQGQEAAMKALQQRRDFRGMGINGSDDAIAQNLRDMKSMSYAAAMSTDALEEFYSTLSADGSLQALASQYDKMDMEAKRKAVNKDISMMLKHGQALGYSTEQIKRNIAEQANNRFKDLPGMIQGTIGARMDSSIARSMGISVSEAEEQALADMAESGIVSPEALEAQQRIRAETAKRYAEADRETKRQMGAQFTVARNVGGTLFDAEQLNAASQANQSRQAQFGKDSADKILSDPDVVNGAYKTVDELQKLPDNLNKFNSSLLLMEQELKNAKDMITGAVNNPGYKAAESIGSSIGNYLLNGFATALAFKVLGAGAGGATGGLGVGGVLGKLFTGVRGVGGLAMGGMTGLGGLATSGVGAAPLAASVGAAGIGGIGGAYLGKAISDNILQSSGSLGTEAGGAIGNFIGKTMAVGMSLMGSDTASGALRADAASSEKKEPTATEQFDKMIKEQREKAAREEAERGMGTDPQSEANKHLAEIAAATKATADGVASQAQTEAERTALERAKAAKNAEVGAALRSAQAGRDRVRAAIG